MPLIRTIRGGRVLNLKVLEAGLAANVGVWEGAAFLIPSDLSFDARGIGSKTLLRRLIFIFLNEDLKGLEGALNDLRHLDTFARIIAKQA